MGMEGGGWILSRGEGVKRNPELLTRDLDELFKDQGGHGLPVRIDPSPGTLEELHEINETTARVLLKAASLSVRFPQQSATLIGGLAVAVHTGRIYREHTDIDFAVTRDFFERHLANLPGILQVAKSIYRTTADVGVAVSSGTRHVNTPRVRVDFFVYDSEGLAYNFSGTRGHIALSERHPIQAEVRSLLGLPFSVAPREVVVSLKQLDGRPKGRLDYRMLRAND